MARRLNNGAGEPIQTQRPAVAPAGGAGYSNLNRQLPGRLRVALVDSDQSVHEFVRNALEAHAKGWRLDGYLSPDSALGALGSMSATSHGARSEMPTSRDIPSSNALADGGTGRTPVLRCGDAPHSPGPPDVILMEARWPGLSGMDCLRKLIVRLPKLRIVMLTACTDHDTIVQSVMAGGLGYLIKPAAPEYLVWALSEAAQGRPVLCGEAQAAVMDLIRRINATRRWKTLSAREREIMVLMTEGATSGDIARKLSISPGTADWHVNNIFKKMQVHSRDQARRKFVGGGVNSSSPAAD